MIKFEACEPFEALVADRLDDHGSKQIVLGFIGGQPVVQSHLLDNYVTYRYYKKIEPECVPLDSTDEIPAWCVGEVFHNMSEPTKFVGINKNPDYYGDLMFQSNGVRYGMKLDMVASERLEIRLSEKCFKFYKVKP